MCFTLSYYPKGSDLTCILLNQTDNVKVLQNAWLKEISIYILYIISYFLVPSHLLTSSQVLLENTMQLIWWLWPSHHFSAFIAHLGIEWARRHDSLQLDCKFERLAPPILLAALPVDALKAIRAQLPRLSYSSWLGIQEGILSLLPVHREHLIQLRNKGLG